MFTTDELKRMKEQIGEAGFPKGGGTETQIFCALVQANAQIKAGEMIKEGLLEVRDSIQKAGQWIADGLIK